MNVNLLLWCLFLGAVSCETHFGKEANDRADWVDPSDMLNFDISSGKMKKIQKAKHDETEKKFQEFNNPKLNFESIEGDGTFNQKCNHDLDSCTKDRQIIQKSLERCEDQLHFKPVSDVPYFKQYVRAVLEKIPDAENLLLYHDEIAYSVNIVLSQSELDNLKSFANTKEGNMQDAHKALVDMLREVQLHREYEPETWKSWVIEILTVYLVTLLQLSAVCAMFSIAIYAQMMLRISWATFFMKLLVLLFMVSVPWNWWHLYKVELAQRQAEAMKDMPSECTPQDQTMWQVITAAFSVHVDKCAKYHEQMMVDPMWEVAPTRAIAVTITKFLLEPLEYIGRALGKFIRAPLEELPVHMWPFALIFVVVVFILVLIMSFGYRIKLFYLFGLEPDGKKQLKGVENLQKEIEALTSKVEAIGVNSKHSIEESTERIVDRRIHSLMGPNDIHNTETETIGANIDYVDSRNVSRVSFLSSRQLALQGGVPHRTSSLEDLRPARNIRSDTGILPSSNLLSNPCQNIYAARAEPCVALSDTNYNLSELKNATIINKIPNTKFNSASTTGSFQSDVNEQVQQEIMPEDFSRDMDCYTEGSHGNTVRLSKEFNSKSENGLSTNTEKCILRNNSDEKLQEKQSEVIEASTLCSTHDAISAKVEPDSECDSISGKGSLHGKSSVIGSDKKELHNEALFESNVEESASLGSGSSCDKISTISNSESFEVIAESDSEESEEKQLIGVGVENIGSFS